MNGGIMLPVIMVTGSPIITRLTNDLAATKAILLFVMKHTSKGMKVIQDAVYNHVSNHHWFVLDPPMKDWINNWPAFKGPITGKKYCLISMPLKYDKKQMLDGWFIAHLPDLNQRNPFLANFLVQHAIWTTEYFGIDGWRVDTYKYCDEDFMNQVNTALEKEFPGINIFGEAWVNSLGGECLLHAEQYEHSF